MTEKQIEQGKQFFVDCFREFEWLDDCTFTIESGMYEKYCKDRGLHQEIRDTKTWEFLMETLGKAAMEATQKYIEEDSSCS